MSSKTAKEDRRKRRIKKKKRLLIIEIVILAVLCVAAFASHWVNRKLGLVNFESTNEDKLITADEANENESAVDLSGKKIIALVGLDRRDGEEHNNSDTMIICLLDHDKKTIKLASLYRDTYLNIGNDKYTKANAAYATGGPEQMLTMMNLNFDLNLEEYVTVNFQAVADAVELLGGVDIELSRDEIKALNGLNNETSKVTGYDYNLLTVPSEEELPDGEYQLTHLDGSQALSYARIRYTAGNDFRRTARQRVLIEKILEKMKNSSASTVDAVLEKVLPQVETNISKKEILSMVEPVLSYKISDTTGFPFDHYEDDGSVTDLTCVIPVTLETNAEKLHEFLFPDESYTPSETVRKYSEHISDETGLTEEDIPESSADGELPWNPEYSGGEQVSSSSNTESSSE
ncbi:MAG: LCP family protein [Bilifractor sp.]|jgi:LCP family protein required for cell wall assembly